MIHKFTFIKIKFKFKLKSWKIQTLIPQKVKQKNNSQCLQHSMLYSLLLQCSFERFNLSWLTASTTERGGKILFNFNKSFSTAEISLRNSKSSSGDAFTKTVIRHWHFAHRVASTIPKEKIQRQGTEPPIFPSYFSTGHISPLQQLPDTSESKH